MPVYRGPQPYTELDEATFFGRAHEVHKIADLVEENRLSILTAPSGVGKTSALLAGVVPQLRRRHEQELLDNEIRLGATLVCRNWLGRALRTPAQMLIDAVTQAVDDLNTRDKTIFLSPANSTDVLEPLLAQEALALREVLSELRSTGNVDWLGTMISCANRVERLVLVFDQFEDALRLSYDGGRRLLQNISALFHRDSRLRLLLSFRQEFLLHIRHLDESIGDLLERTYYLQAITKQSLKQIVQSPAEHIELVITDDAVKKLSEWLDASLTDQEEALSSVDDPDHVTVPDDDAPLPLLILQALLVDVYDVLIRTGRHQQIDKAALREYAAIRALDGRHLARGVLENHIDKALTVSTNGPYAVALDNTALTASAAERNLLIQRLFARMPALLTSGSRPGTPGYKKQAEMGTLIRDVLQDDFEALNVSYTREQIDDFLNFVKDPNNAVDFKKKQRDLASDDRRSGVARRARWTNGRTAKVLLLALAELLHRLVKGNILKPLESEGELAYELVHDGLGFPVQRWSQKHLTRPNDALGSVTQLNGVTFRWPTGTPLPETIDSVYWSGCVIRDQVLDGVVFRRCKLQGTMFLRCSFRGGGFENCELDGAMFIESKFMAASGTNAPHYFRGGNMTSALFKTCEFQSSSIHDVILNGSVFIGNDFQGRLGIDNCSLEVVVFRDCEHILKEPPADSPEGIFISNSDFIFSRVLRHANPDIPQTPVFIGADNQIFPADIALVSADTIHRHSRTR
jgi:uncharacterized protein YjbI with pentapeptide repeats